MVRLPNTGLRCMVFLLFCCVITGIHAQTATIRGKVRDKKDNSELIGVSVLIKGTSLGATTDADGNFSIRNIRPGEYAVEVSYIGYIRVLLTGIKVKANDVKDLQIDLLPSTYTIEQDIVIVGKKPLIDIDKAQSVNTITQDAIELAPARQLQQIVSTQPGVIQSPAGVSIRGSRTYETGLYIDGVRVTDPLAGTGFGLDIGSNAVSDIEITTGGVGAETGDATAGVIRTKTRKGGDRMEVSASYKRDNFGFNKSYASCWNNQIAELNVGGPLLGRRLENRLKFSVALRGSFSDEFYRNPARQVRSSLYPQNNGSLWAPYQDNRWSIFANLQYNFKQGKSLTFSQLRSISINQDINMLRIFGNDLPYQPGYQYAFSEMMDNANTFTHESYMTSLEWKQSVSKRFSYSVLLSRFFVRLRADANGRPWRPDEINAEFDPASITLFPTTYFNPGAAVAYVSLPGGFYNNGGIATLWHDHFYEEYTARTEGNLFSKNALNKFTFGAELNFRHMQWIDIIRPWIGAPIPLANGGTSQSFRLGQQSDVWETKPQRGGFYVTNQIKYKGLVASIGGRLEYWAPGAYVDEAIANPKAPILDELRNSYLLHSTKIGDLRYKFRFLPKLSATFPVRENQMLYFNYAHTTILPHPSFVYPGFNPLYQDRSTAANVGNPDLNPEVDISYEIGLKTQLTSNDAFTITAFWKDKYDFITTTSLLIPDITGREIARTIRINGDYARSRGIELGYIKRIGNGYNGQVSFTYMATTGQSASANEKIKELQASGSVEDTREYYLPWDVPYDLKSNHQFKIADKDGLWGITALRYIQVYVETVLRSGVRYTPYVFDRIDPNTGRPLYVMNTNPDARWSAIGEYWFWTDFTLTKAWKAGKRVQVSWNIQITNLFNNKNAAIINPVTGKAYEDGDDVPDTWVDPRFRDPRLGITGPPPSNPARYLPQRHILTGIAVKF